MTASHDRRAIGRRPRLRRFFQVILVAAVLSPMFSFAAPAAPVSADPLSDAIAEQQHLAKLIADQKAQLTKIAKQQSSLKTQIAATQQNLVDVRLTLDQTQAQIDSLQGTLNQVTSDYTQLLAKQSLLQGEILRLQAQEAAKQQELDVRQAILAARLRDAYITDQTPVLNQILTAHSLTEALSDVSYYGDLAQADKAMADQILEDQKVLAEIHTSLDSALAANQSMTAQVAGEKKTLDDSNTQLTKAKKDLAALTKKLNAQLAAQQIAQAKLDKNAVALKAAVRSNGLAMDDLANKIDAILAKEKGTGRIPSVYNGQLHWPMGGVITQEFGCTGVTSEPRVGSCAHFHQGIDIAAPCNTPIYAAAPGVVIYATYNSYDAPPKAWLVIIAHSTSMVTWYAHMTAHNPAGIFVGATVRAGQLVGTENTTGHSTGCHLHWAVRVNGQFMNPRLFL